MEKLQRLAKGFDTKPLLDSIARQPGLWRQFTARQDTQGSPHADTETIFLRWAKGQTADAAFNEIPAFAYPAMEDLPEAKPLIDRLLGLVNAAELGRVIITNLKPSGYITPHSDEGAYADHYERFHVCLDSDRGNIFFCGDDEAGEFVHMKPGEAWWFNHKVRHWVTNGSAVPRIHLIVDAVAPGFRRERHA